MASHLPTPWTVDDFLQWEAQQPERYEFVDGMIVGMLGGSVADATIRDNVTAALRDRLRGSGCRALSQEVKVASGVNVQYPDVMVTCSPIEPTADQVRDPVVVVEVSSRTTGDRDRGAKWIAYRELPSLQHYVLIDQSRRFVEVYRRDGDAWSLTLYAPPLQNVPLPAIGVELQLDDLYADSGC
jgi:Uma2 family endonuclease